MVLQVDAVIEDRPAGADPLDIRDRANWLDPLVEFDPAPLNQQLAIHGAAPMFCWQGWQATLEAGGKWEWSNHFATPIGTAGEYRRAVRVTGEPLKLTSTQTRNDRARWLVLDAARLPPTSRPARVAVRVGTEHQEFDLPVYDAGRMDLRPIIVPLVEAGSSTGTEVDLEIRQYPSDSAVLWRALCIAEQHPLVYCILEEPDTKLPETLGQGTTRVDRQERYAGRASLQISAVASPAQWQWRARESIVIRERPQLGEYRFLRLALRQSPATGLKLVMDNAASGRPCIFETGPGRSTDPSVRRLTTQDSSDKWLVITRDLYGDFGNLELTGLSVQVPTGATAWIDHFYLARTQNDFELIPALAAAASAAR
jgi:hypothetical protein